MSELFHVLRVDHILGFFRIWEIPREKCVRGLLGHYYPCIPIAKSELEQRGLWDIDRYTKPYIRWHILYAKFGEEAVEVSKKYFVPRGVDASDDYFDFKPEYDTEKKIEASLNKDIADDKKRAHYMNCLFQLVQNVCLIEDQFKPNFYHVRSEVKTEHIEETPNGPIKYVSTSWNELPSDQRKAMEDLYIDFAYKRNNSLWVQKSQPKLEILKNSTNMLICAEDLGQLTDEILNAIREKSLLSLRVQRMSKDSSKDFDETDTFQYLSVCCPSTHDCSSLRGWWEENRPLICKYWHDQLWRRDECPMTCEPWISEMIIRKHLWSNSMWAVFLLQDLTGITQHLRRQLPAEELINFPPDPNYHWRYRYPYTINELLGDFEFTHKVHELVIQSNRI